jgi:pimeloyl-ACP methyl ester carboxylesterase
MPRSIDGYLISCQPVGRGDSYDGYWQHYVGPTEDRFIAPEHSAELAANIPGARLADIAGGHASIFENPRQTQQMLLAFLAHS